MSQEPLRTEVNTPLWSYTMKQAFLAAAMTKAAPAGAQGPCPESDSTHQEFTVQWDPKF